MNQDAFEGSETVEETEDLSEKDTTSSDNREPRRLTELYPTGMIFHIGPCGEFNVERWDRG